MRPHALVGLLGGALLLSGIASAPAATSSSLTVIPDSAGLGRVVVEVRGAPAAALREYLGRDPSAARRDAVFSLALKRTNSTPHTAPIPMLARLEWQGGAARLIPQAPLTRSLTYVATFDGPKIRPGLPRLAREYRVPADVQPSTGIVSALYPRDPVVPANLLKFYLCFSVPMAEGTLFRHVRLLDPAGKPIPQALREVELWSAEHRRATLWISPGRTKGSLGLSEALGPVLRPHGAYTLQVTPGLRDQRGRALTSGYRHAFRTSGFDREQPRIEKWQVTAPAAGSAEPLVVRFGEPLDHFLAARVIGVEDEQGHAVAGRAQAAEDGRSWTFRPRGVWSPGRYSVVAGGELEDLAGNSLLRPFEAPTGTAAKPAAAPPVFRRDFRVGG